MARLRWTALAISLPLLALGCGGGPPETAAEDPPLTAGEAVRALRENADSFGPAIIYLPAEDEPVLAVGGDEVTYGDWRFDLRARTFRGVKTFPPLGQRHRHNEVDGVFERDVQGQWRARVTRAYSGG